MHRDNCERVLRSTDRIAAALLSLSYITAPLLGREACAMVPRSSLRPLKLLLQNATYQVAYKQ